MAHFAYSGQEKWPRIPLRGPKCQFANTQNTVSYKIGLFNIAQTAFAPPIHSSFLIGGALVHEEANERWYQLCQLAAIEPDPGKLLALVAEVNRLLKEREESFNGLRRSDVRG